MGIMANTKSDEEVQTSYLIEFKDGVILPAYLRDDARRPVLQVKGDKKIDEIQPWLGKVLYDMKSGVITANDGEYSLEYHEDISVGRDASSRYKYRHENKTILLDVDHGYYTLNYDPKIGYGSGTRIDQNTVYFSDLKVPEVDLKTARIISTLVSALALFAGQKFRHKNPDAETIILDALKDVSIYVGKNKD